MRQKGGFVTAYSYLNGGPPTTAEVQTFMESYGATRGWYDVHVSEASAYQGKGDGFNVGYSFDPEGAATATHDVGVGSMFISTNGLEKLMAWDAGIEEQSSGSGNTGGEAKSQGIETAFLANASLDASLIMNTVSSKITGVAESSALKTLGRVTGIIGVADHFYKAYENHDWVEGVEGLAQTAVMIFGGEELELAYNIADLGVTSLLDLFK